MQQQYIEIVNGDNKILRGYKSLPTNFNGTIIVMYHGFTGNKTEHGRIFTNFTRRISKLGYGAVRFDFSGNGESDGDFSEMTFQTLIDEANMILDYAKRIPNVKKIIVLGFSMGGAIASLISKQRVNEIAGQLLWAPAGNISEIIAKYFSSGNKLSNGNVDHFGWEISEKLFRQSQELKIYENLQRFNKPSLVIHGEKDLAVSYKWGEKFAFLYPQGKFILIKDAPHGFNSIVYREELFSKSIDFIKNI